RLSDGDQHRQGRWPVGRSSAHPSARWPSDDMAAGLTARAYRSLRCGRRGYPLRSETSRWVTLNRGEVPTLALVRRDPIRSEVIAARTSAPPAQICNCPALARLLPHFVAEMPSFARRATRGRKGGTSKRGALEMSASPTDLEGRRNGPSQARPPSASDRAQ